MTYTPLKHIVFIPGPPWGHLRPGLKTSLRMVEKFPDLFISLFAYHPEVPKALKYLSAQPSAYSKRIRVVTAASEENDAPVTSGNEVEVITNLEKSFGLWITSELQQASIIQLDGRPVDVPSLIIEDMFNGGVSLAFKDIHGLPVMAWWLMTAASMMLMRGTKDQGAFFDRLIPRDTQGEDTSSRNRCLYDFEIYPASEVHDPLVYMPGIPAHYEWEIVTQDLPFMAPIIPFMFPRWKRMAMHADTAICCTTFAFEPIAAAALSTSFKTPPYFVGPAVDLTPPHKPDPESPVTQFLDRAYTENGAHSVIYVAFGTVFFPPDSSLNLLMAALDEIPKAGFKFIFARSSDKSRLIDQSWMDAHIEAGNAIFPEWTNQTAVLEHPAIHYFLSHGGWNSSTEAIVRGVPMIFWPVAGDQPLNSAQIASVHDCGFELLQVRTGPAKSTAYRNGTNVKIIGTEDAVREEMRDILALSQGLRGEHQRTNVGLLGNIVAESLAPGGSGDVGLEQFGKALGFA